MRFLGWMLLLMAGGVTWGQTAAPKKPLAFEVVSIKPDKEGGTQRFGPTPDGYSLRNLFMAIPILTAYVPQTDGPAMYKDDQQVNFPDWVTNDRYDIDAKVSEADLADWHDPKKQPTMLREMLQTMMTERLKLTVHRASKEGNVYELVVGKDGPKFKETDPAVIHKGQFTMPDGTVVVSEASRCEVITHYWGITMPMASFTMNAAGRQVVDKTGLTGRYDLTKTWTRPACLPEGTTPEDPVQEVFRFVEELGLKLVPAKGPIETLVIDHIEKPTEN